MADKISSDNDVELIADLICLGDAVLPCMLVNAMLHHLGGRLLWPIFVWSSYVTLSA